ATEIPYEQTPTPDTLQKRLIAHARTYYRANDLSGPLPLGEFQSLALPFQTCRLAFTPGLLTAVHADKLEESMLTIDGRYIHTEGDAQWWIPSGRYIFTPDPAANAA